VKTGQRTEDWMKNMVMHIVTFLSAEEPKWRRILPKKPDNWTTVSFLEEGGRSTVEKATPQKIGFFVSDLSSFGC
ncbi:Hypothetical predicted protein, partial [Olea europaea subsp. europaea]